MDSMAIILLSSHAEGPTGRDQQDDTIIQVSL
jgi:hypothetical protein